MDDGILGKMADWHMLTFLASSRAKSNERPRGNSEEIKASFSECGSSFEWKMFWKWNEKLRMQHPCQ